MDFAQAHEVIRQDGEFPGEADQFVELGGVDPDSGVRARRDTRVRCAIPAAAGGKTESEVGTETGAGGDSRRSPLRSQREIRPGARRSRPHSPVRVTGGGAADLVRIYAQPNAIVGSTFDDDGAILGKEQEHLVEPIGFRVGVDVDRPVQITPLRVDLVERGNLLRIRGDRRRRPARAARRRRRAD